MALFVLKMMTGSHNWVRGECDLLGYETMIMVQSIHYGIDVKSVLPEDGRRTVHLPALSKFTLNRKLDLATPEITKWALTARVAPAPWTIYFFRALGGFMDMEMWSHSCDLELTLNRALITDQNITFDGNDTVETLEVSAPDVTWTYYAHGSSSCPEGRVSYRFDTQSGWVE